MYILDAVQTGIALQDIAAAAFAMIAVVMETARLVINALVELVRLSQERIRDVGRIKPVSTALALMILIPAAVLEAAGK